MCEIYAFCSKAHQTCADGYTNVHGHIAGTGVVNSRGGGEAVSSCADCAALCTAEEGCKSYACSPSDFKCNLNGPGEITSPWDHRDYALCLKGGSNLPCTESHKCVFAVPWCEYVNNRFPSISYI